VVAKEHFDTSTARILREFTPTELRRNAAGDYTIVLDATVTAHLPDGRSVKFTGEVRLKGKQYGRALRRGGLAEFGRWLRGIREERGLSLRDVEARTGISNPLLSQLETGKIQSPSAAVCWKLACLYDVDARDMLARASGSE
jgi:DNA-binding XRE family transcriptional regulator